MGAVKPVTHGAASEGQKAQCVVIRTTPGQYALWGALLAIVVLFGYSAGAFDVRAQPSKWVGILLLSGAWSAIFYWWLCFKIEITDHQLSYRSPFKGSISLTRKDVTGYRLYEGLRSTRGSLPVHTIVIQTQTRGDIEINTKPFSKSDIGILIRLLDRDPGASHGLPIQP
jgi:hypothetical protein